MLDSLSNKTFDNNTLPELPTITKTTSIHAHKLKRYNKVCEINDQNLIPPTYFYVLAFPSLISLLRNKYFPFKLLGLIHTNQKIEQFRKVKQDETLTLKTYFNRYWNHSSGVKFEIITIAYVKNECVWKGTSTLLSKVGTSTLRKKYKSSSIEEKYFKYGILNLPKNIGLKYALISKDFNPIHLFNFTARLFGLKHSIAHGMYLVARISSILITDDRYPLKMDIEFKKPIGFPNSLGIYTLRDKNQTLCDIKIRNCEPPALSCKITPLL